MDRERLDPALAGFLKRSVAFAALMFLVRTYELVATHGAHVLPAGMGRVIGFGLLDDTSTAALISIIIALPIVGLAMFAPRVASVTHRIVIVAVVVIAVALSRFFAITFVPLGADFWGYSFSELTETTAASSGGWTVVIPFIIAAIVAWLLTGLAERRLPGGRWTTPVAVVLIAFAFGRGLVAPTPSRFSDDASYYLALDKTRHFASRSLGYAREEFHAAAASYPRYPILTPSRAKDILGPLLNPAARAPNFVFIIVEGLGRDFVGPGAQFGGFTPHIDSIAARGLFWDNFLSNTGRTFGVLPSLLASAPYGKSGFASLGDRMPNHLGLLRWLARNGYASNYFTGTAGSFDGIDAFMERQNVGRFSDVTSFPAGMAKEPGGAGGFSWGYADRDLFAHSLEQLGPAAAEPRVDVYLTITTHEPFIPPDSAAYAQRFRDRLTAIAPAPRERAVYEEYRNVFATLLYLDDAVAYFLGEYAKRRDFGRTIFIITGDHRLIPVPQASRLSRFRVPFIISSPLVKAPRRFASVSSHLDVTPTIATYLAANYGMTLLSEVPWLGDGIDSSVAFRNVHAIPLMRSKNELDDYLVGNRFLSGDRLFAVDSSLNLVQVEEPSVRDSLSRALSAFRGLNRYLTSGENIFPETPSDREERLLREADNAVVERLGIAAKLPEAQLAVARRQAEAKHYDTARAVLRRILRTTPSYHDARALLGRSLAWQNRFAEADTVLTDLNHRAPEYLDGWLARIDLAIWQKQSALALARVDSAARIFGTKAEILFGRARALEIAGRRPEALAAVDAALRLNPTLAGASDVRARLQK